MRLIAFFIEILPLVSFFMVYEWAGLLAAAAVSSALGLGLLAFARLKEGRVAIFPLFSVGLSLILTLSAWLLDANVFIKIQPTLFNGLFALVLLAGALRGEAMMKRFFGAQFRLDDGTWMKLSLRWGMFFTFLAVANELAWRNLDEAGWVQMKVFVFAPLSGLFMLAQLPLTLRGRID
ncbi:MAG: inner membrane-spanning protein YciB [Candidatus Puniceispirillales bacterium]